MADTWYLVRHPDKEGDEEGLYLGDVARITKKGEVEAEQMVHRIGSLAVMPEMLISSVIPRALQLAMHIGHTLNLPTRASPLFNEIDKPEFLVGTYRSDPVHQSTMQAIRDMFDEDRVPPGISVKTRTELEEETRQAFAFIEALEFTTVLSVGHAKRIASHIHWVYNCGRTLKGYYDTVDRTVMLDTTGVTILKRKPDRRTGEMHWHIATINDTSHSEGFLSGNAQLTKDLGLT